MSDFRYADRLNGVTLSGIREVFEAAGEASINLGLGEPDFDTPSGVKDAAKNAIDRGETAYTQNLGVEELREAVAERYRSRYDAPYGPENVMITSGASEALHLATQVLVNPGDDVVMTDPGFISYSNLAAVAGGRTKRLETPQRDGFVPDPDRYAELVTGNEALLNLNSPCNPTGAVYPEETLRGLVEVSEDHGIPVLSDEVYDEFVYHGEHVSPAALGDNVVVVNSFSKSFAMTGWRLGYLLAPTDFVEQALKVHQYIQACASSVSQAAGLAALRNAREFPRQMRETFRGRRDLLSKGLGEMGVECAEPGGAFYAFPDVSRFGGGTRVAKRLAREGVLTVPGSAFGSRDDNLRISYAAALDDIESALDVMRDVLPELEAET